MVEPKLRLNLWCSLRMRISQLNLAFPVSFLTLIAINELAEILRPSGHTLFRRMIIDFSGSFMVVIRFKRNIVKNPLEDYLREIWGWIQWNISNLFRGERISIAASFNQSAIQKKVRFFTFVLEVMWRNWKRTPLTSFQWKSWYFNLSVRVIQFAAQLQELRLLCFWESFFVTQ